MFMGNKLSSSQDLVVGLVFCITEKEDSLIHRDQLCKSFLEGSFFSNQLPVSIPISLYLDLSCIKVFSCTVPLIKSIWKYRTNPKVWNYLKVVDK